MGIKYDYLLNRLKTEQDYQPSVGSVEEYADTISGVDLKQNQCQNYYSGPLLAIVDDDGYHNFLDAGIADLYRTKGVRPSLAIVACRAQTTEGTTTSGDPYYAMSWVQLSTLAQDGFQILNHSYSHDVNVFRATATEAQFLYEYQESQKLFLQHGFAPKSIIYPFGNPTTLGSNPARKYFQYGVLYKGGDTGVVDFNTNFNYARIPRNTSATYNTVTPYLDACAANNQFLVLGTHSYGGPDQTGAIRKPAPSVAQLSQILDYAINLGIRIEPFQRAIRIRQPKLDCGTSDSTRITILGDGTFNDRFVQRLIARAVQLGLLDNTPAVIATSLTITYTGGNQIVGATVDLTDCTVVVNYSDNTTATVTTGYYIDPNSSTVVLGQNTYTVYYNTGTNTVSGTFTMTGQVVTIPATDFQLPNTNGQISIASSLPDGKAFQLTFTPQNANSGLAVNWTASPQGSMTATQTGSVVKVLSVSGEEQARTLTGVLASDATKTHAYTVPAQHTYVVEYVDYVESGPDASATTATNYCNYFLTDYTPNGNTKIQADFQPLVSTTSAMGALFGSRLTASTGAFYCYPQSSLGVNCNVGTQQVQASLGNTTRKTLIMDKNGVSIDGASVGTFSGVDSTMQTPCPMAILGLNQNGTITTGRRIKSTRLFQLKVYQSDVLVRDYKPALIDGTLGLWDAVNAAPLFKVMDCRLYYGNIYANNTLLECSYTTTGNADGAFITDFTPNQNTKLVTTVEGIFTSTAKSTVGAVFGTRTDYTTNAYLMYISQGASNSTAIVTIGSVASSSFDVPTTKNVYTIDSTGVLMNGTQVATFSGTIADFTPPAPLAIMNTNTADGANSYRSFKFGSFYGLQVYQSGTLVHNYIPTYNESTQAPMLYDSVTSTSIAFSGTVSNAMTNVRIYQQ